MAQHGPSDVDLQIARSRAALERARTRAPTQQGRASAAQLRRAKRMATIGIGGAALVFLMLIVIAIGAAIGPAVIGLALVAMLAVMCAAILFSRDAPVTVEQIRQGSLPQIADRTNDWLMQQRRALPAPAQTLADSIGDRIANLRPQLETVDARTVEAQELKRLVGEDLPDLVTKYAAVPANLRREERNGRVPEAELVAGLKLVDQQIDGIARTLGAEKMDKLSSQKRYLELRYDAGDNSAH